MFLRWDESGSLTLNRLGIRRRMAASMSLGRLVAPKTRILVSFVVLSPSHMLMNSAFIMPVTSWSLLLRCRRNESISSMKMMEGCSLRASENRAETSLLLSPNHLSVRVETCMLIKVAPDSLASACGHGGGAGGKSGVSQLN